MGAAKPLTDAERLLTPLPRIIFPASLLLNLGQPFRMSSRALGRARRRQGELSDGGQVSVAGVGAEPDLDIVLAPLAGEGHARRLGLAAERPEAVLDDPALGGAADVEDLVDLEVELGLEVGGQEGLVDDAGGARDLQHPRLVPGPPLLGRADAVPNDPPALRAAGHGEPAGAAALVEQALGGGPLEEDDLGGAGAVALVGLGGVDVRGVDAAGVADVGEELAGRDVGRQVEDEEGAVLVLRYVGRAVPRQADVAAVVGREARDHASPGLVLRRERAALLLGGGVPLR